MVKANNLFHYTSIKALLGIVQKDGLHFRASRYDCMNDSEEYKWLYEPLKARIAKEQSMSDDDVDNFYEKFPYIISLSEKEDNDEMWNKYGINGNGVCIVLNKEFIIAEAKQHLQENWDIAMTVRYADEKAKLDTLAEVVEEYRKLGYGTANEQEVFEDEIYCSAFVKNKAMWEGEAEFRYARIRERGMEAKYSIRGGEFTYPEDKRNIKLRPDKSIPYLDMVFPLQVLDRIIVGPHMDVGGMEKIKKELENTVGKVIDVAPSNVKF